MNRRVLFIEPFYGGSHKQVADELVARSRHRIELLTLPARFWKWRRRLSAFELVCRLESTGRSPSEFDLIVVSDYVDIGDLRALLCRLPPPGDRLPPIGWYCHETQSTYPLPKGSTVEADVVAADLRNALHADAIAFNSRFHYAAFLEVCRRHLADLAEWEPEWRIATREMLEQKSRVVYPGVRCVGAGGDDRGSPQSGGPLILWNHRWEYDKNFSLFARVAGRLVSAGVGFRIAILGENPQAEPKEFLAAQSQLAGRIEAFGYAETREEYLAWLKRAEIVVSTAIQENFGIAVLEAMSAGCVPLLPNRLAYPEILPERLHEACLFTGDREMERKLLALIVAAAEAGRAPDAGWFASLKYAAIECGERFCWEQRIGEFDEWIDDAARLGDGPPAKHR